MRIGDVVLHRAVATRRAFAAADALHQAFVDFADQRFGDGFTAAQVFRHQVEGVAVIEQLADVIRARFRDGFARKQPLGLRQRQLGALDVRGRVTSSRRDFHPLDSAHAGRTKSKKAPFSQGLFVSCAGAILRLDNMPTVEIWALLA